MPQPVFIICSQSAIVDQSTGLFTAFNVLEGFTATVQEMPEPPSAQGHMERLEGEPGSGIKFYVTAVWMRLDDEPLGRTYKFQIAVTPPGGEERMLDGDDPIVFDKRFIRITAGVALSLAWPQGIIWVEVRIRHAGDDQWLAQRFPIPLTVRLTEAREEQP